MVSIESVYISSRWWHTRPFNKILLNPQSVSLIFLAFAIPDNKLIIFKNLFIVDFDTRLLVKLDKDIQQHK